MKRVLPAAAVLILTLTGCILTSEKYKSPGLYDLSTDHHVCISALNRLRVKNISGSDRRFLYRIEGNKMKFDEYNFWILSPEQLIRRALDTSFSKRCKKAANLECSISRFEFDLKSNEAILELAFTLSKDNKSKSGFYSVRKKFAGKTASEVACAMDKCVSDAVKHLDSAVTEFSAKGGKER